VRRGNSLPVGLQSLPRYSYVILSASYGAYARMLRSRGARPRVLAYKAAIELADCATSPGCGSGITYREALAHDRVNPRDPWVLKNASGAVMASPPYPDSYLANVGSASYRRRWVARVARSLRGRGFDGVFIDNVLGQISGWSGGVYPSRYPTDAAWERAMAGFVRYAGRALRRRGLYVLASTFKGGSNDGSADIAWWKTIAPNVNGLLAEYWEQSPVSTNRQLFDTNPCCWTGHWLSWLGLAAAAQRHGADFFAGMKGKAADSRAMQYGKASFMLVWNGKGGAFLWQPVDGSDPWNPAWTTDIGRPKRKRYAVGGGWRREYTGGTVLVNPSPFAPQSFDLGGRYVTPAGAAVTSVTLAPVTGMILRRGG
jgi:hypothetical protein